MNDSDKSIEKVLTGLRRSEAQPGMEQRILVTLKRRAAEQIESSWWQRNSRVLRPSPKTMLFCGATLAIVAVLLISPKISWNVHTTSVSVTPPQLAANAIRPSTTAVPATGQRSVTHPEQARGETPQTAHVQRVKAVHAARSDDSSLALREMTAASHPAPPLPLTAQERLLLQVIHKGDPVELAMLNPEVRARHVAEARAEFQEFFKPKTSSDAQ
jgi:hypothetical protein